MTNTERRNKYNTIAAHFTVGAPVAIRTVEGSENGTVNFVGWDHYMDSPFVAVNVMSKRFGPTIARMGVEHVFKKGA